MAVGSLGHTVKIRASSGSKSGSLSAGLLFSLPEERTSWVLLLSFPVR